MEYLHGMKGLPLTTVEVADCEKGLIAKKKVPSDFDCIGEEHQGIIDMTFHLEDYLDTDKASGDGTFVIETDNEDSIMKEKISKDHNSNSVVKEEAANQVEKTDEGEDCVNESLEIVKEMSEILNTKLSSESLNICLNLIEEGADYVALSEIIKKWRLKKTPKPVRELGHFFDKIEDPAKKKKEWVW